MSGPQSQLPDDNAAGELIAVCWAWTSVSLIFVILRMYSRVHVAHKIWWDDWTILATMVFTLVYSSLCTAYANLGGCRHVQYLTPSQTVQVTEINWINQPFAVLAIATSKVSVALLILRLQGPCKWRTYLLYFLAISIWTYAAAIVVVVFTQCRPYTALWTEQGVCMPAQDFVYIGYSYAGYAAFQDLALAIIPITFIYRLQLSLHKRLSLCLVLGVGAFASICAIIKTTKLSELGSSADFTCTHINTEHTASFHLDSASPTPNLPHRNTTDLSPSSSNELNIVIIGACIPAVYPLLTSYLAHRRTSYDSTTTTQRMWPRNHLRGSQDTYVNDSRDYPTQKVEIFSDNHPGRHAHAEGQKHCVGPRVEHGFWVESESR
ncbi:hypothetical protein MMC32_000798 [Xylographa parallela]|nr:hypothetical protein [Xylographa parallela]